MKLELVKSKENEKSKHELYTIGKYEVQVTTYSHGWKSIHVRTERGNYKPEIYSRDDFETGRVLGFEIQTTSYGALPAEEIQKVIEGYNEALEVVAILTKEFVK